MNSSVEKPDAIFFDWDGTLIDSYSFIEGVHQHTHQVLGLEPLKAGAFKHYFGQPKNYIYSRLYKDHAENAKEIFKAHYIDTHLSGLQVLEKAEDVLRAVQNYGVPMGVITNKQADYVLAEIEHLGWQDYFSSVVTAGDAGEDKPSAAPLHLSMERNKLKKPDHTVWLVGDTENDVLCAHNAQQKSILIGGEPEQLLLLEKYYILHNFQNCSEFCDFLLQSFQK